MNFKKIGEQKNINMDAEEYLVLKKYENTKMVRIDREQLEKMMGAE